MKKWMALVLALVCTFSLGGCGGAAEAPDGLAASIMYQGKLYRTTGKQVPAEVEESAVVGCIESVVPLSRFPSADGEANFGQMGDPYAVTADGLLVLVDNEWTLFELMAEEVLADDTENEVLRFLTDKYGMAFTLWGPEGQDLYAFYIYPDHAERECHRLMPENTEDTAEYHKDLAWEVVGEELVITGEWQETFRIDIAGETAVSTATGKEYKIYEMELPLE